MIIKCYPANNELEINGIGLRLHERREVVREMLGLPYEEDNSIFQAGDFDPDPIIVRRDIYTQDNEPEYFFFLDYDKGDLLGEIEIVNCNRIQLNDITFGFEDELDSIALLLDKFSEISILSDGEYFFKDLRVVISDKRKRGGEGNTLGYFYYAADVSHLC